MNPEDMRSQLLWSFVNAVDLTRPKAFVCENVKALATLDKWSEVRQRLFYLVEKLGYSCKLVVLNAADFGVPQVRERMFLIGFQKMEGLENLESLFEMRRKPSPVVRDILLPLGLAGSANNQRVCNAKVLIATRPVLPKPFTKCL
jgi:DNA (cytosine-5)-methyltransferase 1